MGECIVARNRPESSGVNGFNGQVIIDELLRNMELGRFEMAYSTLLPCVFTIYLHPDDYARLAGVFSLVAEDAKRALAERVATLNKRPKFPGLQRGRAREFRIAARDWAIEFLQDNEGGVPVGDVEIHSNLNDAARPGFQGAKTTLIDREPSVTSRPAGPAIDTHKASDRIYAEIRYEDESGPQLYRMVQNVVRVGRGGDQEPMELALYTNDEVSREHLVLRREAATGEFFIEDRSTNGTWLDGKRLKNGQPQALPEHAEIGVAEVLTLVFQVRK